MPLHQGIGARADAGGREFISVAEAFAEATRVTHR